MKISVKVIARAKQDGVEQTADGNYKIWVRAPAENGKANRRVVELLSDFFKRPKGRIFIVAGETSSKKIIAIE